MMLLAYYYKEDFTNIICTLVLYDNVADDIVTSSAVVADVSDYLIGGLYDNNNKYYGEGDIEVFMNSDKARKKFRFGEYINYLTSEYGNSVTV